MNMLPKVAIIAGSKSDEDVVVKAAHVLRDLGITFEARVMSAHRTPNVLDGYIRSVESSVKVYIAVAGMAAHLAGAIAARTCVPVIGVPAGKSSLNGLDALLSTVQMPSGVPVATVAIDGGSNAAWLAAQILATGDDSLRRKLVQKRAEQAEDVQKANTALNANLTSDPAI